MQTCGYRPPSGPRQGRVMAGAVGALRLLPHPQTASQSGVEKGGEGGVLLLPVRLPQLGVTGFTPFCWGRCKKNDGNR